MEVQEAAFGKGEVIDHPFAGIVVQARQLHVEVRRVAVHQHGDLPARRRLMAADANISKTPASRHLRRQVRADAAVELEQKVVKG